ncbi:protein ADM2 [Gastrophryne carolinensis]
MKSWMAVSLSCMSLLFVQQFPGAFSMPSQHLLLLPTPREPHEREEQLAEVAPTHQPPLIPVVTMLKEHLRILRRKRRRARRHPPRLMRVGCSLGTCQVQNLNHRLWQLMGQIGKDDSPIQLSNPHSFG